MTTEAQARSFFVAQSLLHARSLPLRDAQAFLKGLLLFTEDREETSALRAVYADLCALNDGMEKLQLTLI